MNQFSRLPLDNLRVIRGTTLYEGRFALAVLINYQKDGQHGLQELGLTHLTEILEGGVEIIQNKFLSFAPQINWLDIACRNFNNSGSCVPQCPQTLIYNKHTFKLEPNPSAKYQYGSICVAQCPQNFVVDESSCVSSCPSEKMEVEKKGVKRLCIGTDSLLANRQTVDALNIDSFSNCTKIQGSLHFLVTGIKGASREFANAKRECMPCHRECEVQEGKPTCTGPGADECVACARYKDGPHCVSSCPKGLMGGEGVVFKYPNRQRSCEPCNINCTLGQTTIGIVLGVIAVLFVGFSIFVLTVLYRRGLAIRRKRAVRRYMESGENLPLDPGEKGTKVYARILKATDLRKIKIIGQGVFGAVHKIAKGMYYLEEHRMVHRNLAARNVLLKDNYIVQISDYGIADLLHPDEKKYFYNEVKTPIKWMALESISFRRYTHQSDVWSYGVTIWEMMSYGAEPYAAMRPQEVPDLLESGERLSQPQICTIDVYMVMVKCWMVDENVRPTFKELANEFTRMARDPPRYLVIKGGCNAQDSAQGENLQWSANLEELNGELEDQEPDGMATRTPLFMSQSRSLSRLSRMDSMRVIQTPSSVAGYLPMTPGVDTPGQGMWQSRSRLNSARTVSESSEGRGTAMDLEMNEDFSLSGSLKRKRQREDSAYLSQRDSMSGGPPETPSPDIENEEDQNGYVLPGESPKRDTLLFVAQVTPFKDRLCVVHSPGPPSDPDDEEYEYMNKRTSSRPAKHQSQFKDNSSWLQMKDMGGNTSNEDKDSPHSSYSEDRASLEYEYMDIRGSETEVNNPLQTHEVPPRTVATEQPNIAREVLDGVEENDYQEDDNYQYTNRQPKLQQALQDRNEGTGPRRGENDAEEYEEMNSLAALGAEELAVYQNLHGEEEGAVKGTEGHRASGIDPYVKVRAGVSIGEPGSFDNPDYWHSRMFLKSNAVRT
ncbi:hypothetical protein NHX12_029828 [Muraenolepis orangiensis]|uniref:receptor protein-tyrosine kinase n=1 Tax=Muraenolepis orangiensis TaxID=630683 RepID=A0A9Q0IL93_9TELE|nr:hypothetical protein NHX12_029828 [Muraenolepis orangiensis]